MIELLSQTPAAPAPVKATTATSQASSEAASEESVSFSDVLSEETLEAGASEPVSVPDVEAKTPSVKLPDGLDISAASVSKQSLEVPIEISLEGPIETPDAAGAGEAFEGPATDRFAAPTPLEPQPLVAGDAAKARPIAPPGAETPPTADGEITLKTETNAPSIEGEKSIDLANVPARDVETTRSAEMTNLAQTTPVAEAPSAAEISNVDENRSRSAEPQPALEAVLASAATPKAARVQGPATNTAKPGANVDLGSLKDGAPLKSGDTITLNEPGQHSSTRNAESENGADLSKNLAAKPSEQAGESAANSPKSTPAKTNFEQLLTAHTDTQPMDSATSALVAKAAPTDTIAAKSMPEVLVQVPQQRADMAAKQVGIELARQVKNGDTQFVVRMDPPELGKLDVRMTVTKAGEVQATIVVEREATFDLLSRDAKTLERSLADAGLKMDQNALNLSLKQNQSDGFEGQFANASGNGDSDGDGFGDDDMTDTLDSAALAQMQISSGRPLDVIA